MSAIQGSANGWEDATTTYATGNYRSIGAQDRNVWGTASSSSFFTVVSDVEEEGEVAENLRETHQLKTPNPSDDLTTKIESGAVESSATDEIVAAVAAQIGIIEATMRRHRLRENGSFDEHETEGSEDAAEDPAEDNFSESITGDLLQNPASAFSATSPTHDRLGILSLLA